MGAWGELLPAAVIGAGLGVVVAWFVRLAKRRSAPAVVTAGTTTTATLAQRVWAGAAEWVPFVGIVLLLTIAPWSAALVTVVVCGAAVAFYRLETGDRSASRGRALLGALVVAAGVATAAGLAWLWETHWADALLDWLEL